MSDSYLVKKGTVLEMLNKVHHGDSIELISTEGGLIEFTWVGTVIAERHTNYALVTNINAGLCKFEIFREIK